MLYIVGLTNFSDSQRRKEDVIDASYISDMYRSEHKRTYVLILCSGRTFGDTCKYQICRNLTRRVDRIIKNIFLVFYSCSAKVYITQRMNTSGTNWNQTMRKL